MELQRTFCPFSEDFVLAYPEQRYSRTYVKEEEVEFVEKGYISPDYPNRFFTNSSVLNENLLSAKDAYRAKNNLLSRNQIMEFRKSYGLSQKELARVLRWGEATIARYETRSIQERAHDDLLRVLMEEPFRFRKMLEQAKGLLDEEKRLRALELNKKMILEQAPSRNRYFFSEVLAPELSSQKGIYSIWDVVDWLLQRFRKADATISNLKLQKLLYYLQGTFLAQKGFPLFEQELYAWPHGPVSPEVYHKFSKFGSSPIQTKERFGTYTIDSDTERILEFVFNTLGKKEAWALRDKSHEEAPWKNAPKDGLISKESIFKYFVSDYDQVYL